MTETTTETPDRLSAAMIVRTRGAWLVTVSLPSGRQPRCDHPVEITCAAKLADAVRAAKHLAGCHGWEIAAEQDVLDPEAEYYRLYGTSPWDR